MPVKPSIWPVKTLSLLFLRLGDSPFISCNGNMVNKEFGLAILEPRLDYGAEGQNCGCACDECEQGHHKECEYGTCWDQ